MMANVVGGQERVVALLALMTVEHTALRLVLERCVKALGLQDQVQADETKG